MRARVIKIGNWDKFSMLAVNLTRELENARVICLKRWALKAEGTAKKHISTQDFANSFWKPLAPYTVLKKTLQNYPLDTLIETSTYLQSITSWVETETAYAGIKRNTSYKRGHNKGVDTVDNIARLQEFGSTASNLPARPLWEPTFNETLLWHMSANKVGDIFLQIMRLKYS